MNTTPKLESPARELLQARLGKRFPRTSSAPFADLARTLLRRFNIIKSRNHTGFCFLSIILL